MRVPARRSAPALARAHMLLVVAALVAVISTTGAHAQGDGGDVPTSTRRPVPYQPRALVVLYYTSLVISIAATAFIFVMYMAKYGNHLLTNYFGLVLVFLMTVGVSLLFPDPWNDMPQWVCTLQGLMVTYTNVAFMCWLLCFALHLYIVMVMRHKDPQSFLKYFVVFNYVLVPLVPCILTLTASESIEFQSMWCWISSPFWVRFLSVYLITLLAAVTCGIFFVLVLYHLWVHRKEAGVRLHFRNMTTRRIFLFVCIFPLYLALYLWGFIGLATNTFDRGFVTPIEFAASFLGIVLFLIFGTRLRTFRQWYINRASRVVKATKGPGDTIRALEIIRAEEDIFGVVTGYDKHIHVARRQGERLDWDRVLDYSAHARLLMNSISKIKTFEQPHALSLRDLAVLRLAEAKRASGRQLTTQESMTSILHQKMQAMTIPQPPSAPGSDLVEEPSPESAETASPAEPAAPTEYEYDVQKRQAKKYVPEEVDMVLQDVLDVKDASELILEDFSLSQIPDKVLAPPLIDSLCYLYLGDNHIETLPDAIGGLKSLLHLELYSNYLTVLPDSFAQLEKLEVLVLSNNRLRSLPATIKGHMPNLKVVFLNRNLFRTFPTPLLQTADPTSITQLFLHENRLAAVPRAIGKLTSLGVLDVSHNFIKQLPEEIGELPLLRELIANANALESLPRSLVGPFAEGGAEVHPPLERLYFYGNQVQSLPEDALLPYRRTLKHLNMSLNGITTIPRSVFSCTKITSLGFAGNGLTELPATIGRLRHLKYLFLSHNKLTYLPAEIGALKDLERLDVARNSLRTTIWLSWWYLGGPLLMSLRWTQLFTIVLVTALVQMMVVGITIAYTLDPVQHYWSWAAVLGDGFAVSVFFAVLIFPVLYVLRNSQLTYYKRSSSARRSTTRLSMYDRARSSGGALVGAESSADIALEPLKASESSTAVLAKPATADDRDVERARPRATPRLPRFPIWDDFVKSLTWRQPRSAESRSQLELELDALGGYRRPVRLNIQNALAMLLLLIETYQLTAFSFARVIAWGNSSLAFAFRISLFEFDFETDEWNVFVFACAVVFALAVRAVVEMHRYTWKAGNLYKVSVLVSTALYIPVVRALFQSISCTLQVDPIYAAQNITSGDLLLSDPLKPIGWFTLDTGFRDFNLRCYEGFQIFFPIIGLTTLLIYYPHVSLTTAAYQDREVELDIRYRPSYLAIEAQLKFLLTIVTTAFSKRAIVYESINIAIVGILLLLTVIQRPAIISVANYWRVALFFGTFVTSVCALVTAALLVNVDVYPEPMWVVMGTWLAVILFLVIVTAIWLWDLRKLPPKPVDEADVFVEDSQIANVSGQAAQAVANNLVLEAAGVRASGPEVRADAVAAAVGLETTVTSGGGKVKHGTMSLTMMARLRRAMLKAQADEDAGAVSAAGVRAGTDDGAAGVRASESNAAGAGASAE